MQESKDVEPLPGTVGEPSAQGAKMLFAEAVECIGNLYQEFLDARKPSEGSTVTLRSGEMKAFRSAYFALKAARGVLALKCHDALVKAARSALKYDAAISSCANDPKKMASFCTAQGDTLDGLYFDWITDAGAAIALVDGSRAALPPTRTNPLPPADEASP